MLQLGGYNHPESMLCEHKTKVQVHLKKIEYGEKVIFSVKLTYILDSFHVK